MYSELANWDGSQSPPKQPAQRRNNHTGNAVASSTSASASSSSAGTTAPTTPAYIASTSPSAATSTTSINGIPDIIGGKKEIDGNVGIQGDTSVSGLIHIAYGYRRGLADQTFFYLKVETERLFVPNHLLLIPSPAKNPTPSTSVVPKTTARSKLQVGSRIILYSPQAIDERQDGDDEDYVNSMLVSDRVFVPWSCPAEERVVVIRDMLGTTCASGTRLSPYL